MLRAHGLPSEEPVGWVCEGGVRLPGGEDHGTAAGLALHGAAAADLVHDPGR